MVPRADNDAGRSHVLFPVLLSAFAIPVSMLFWIVNVVYSFFSADSADHSEGHPVISPWRWLAAVVVPILFLLWGLRRRGVDWSGALLGLFVGFVMTIASFAHLACLACFFVSSTLATKFRRERKRRLEVGSKEPGRRNWIQVLCNGGMASQLALLYILDVGCGERPVDFINDYRSSWLSVGILGAFACCNGDTWASELGTVLGASDPILITTRKRVPRGTNGGVSWIGLLMSLFGGTAVGLCYYLAILYTVDTVILQSAAAQWPLIMIGGAAGLIGGLIDSLLGATLQYSGLSEAGNIVEHPGKGIKHICGRQILDNNSVNLLSSLIVALTLPRVANYVWP